METTEIDRKTAVENMKKEKQMFLWERHCGFPDFVTLFYNGNMKKHEKIIENIR